MTSRPFASRHILWELGSGPLTKRARYLHYLRNVEFMDYDELIARCGGNKNTITQQIDAFHDMNTFYRDVNSDDAFKGDRFSGFVELQKGRNQGSSLQCRLRSLRLRSLD